MDPLISTFSTFCSVYSIWPFLSALINPTAYGHWSRDAKEPCGYVQHLRRTCFLPCCSKERHPFFAFPLFNHEAYLSLLCLTFLLYISALLQPPCSKHCRKRTIPLPLIRWVSTFQQLFWSPFQQLFWSPSQHVFTPWSIRYKFQIPPITNIKYSSQLYYWPSCSFT